MTRATIAVAIALLAAMTPAAAHAEDYGPSRGDWNGLGYLQVTAEEAKVQASIVDALQLDELGPLDVVFWLYPEEAAPTEQLLRFVADGGGLVIADDFGGGADALLAELGITRAGHGPSAHGRWYENEDGFPVLPVAAQRTPRHFLFYNVEEVVANHPAVLTGGTPVLSYDGGAEHLIVETQRGAGAVLAVADPSIFLNEMLGRFYGNKQLAANVMRYFCREEPCRIQILTPRATFAGEYRPGAGPLGSFPRAVERAAESVDEALTDVEEGLGGPPWWFLLGVGLAGAAILFGLVVLARWRRPVARPVTWADLDARSPLVHRALALAGNAADADFHALAAALVEHADHLVDGHALMTLVRRERPTPPGLHPSELEQAVLRVRRDADSLRAEPPPVISAEHFTRLYDDVKTIEAFVPQRRRPGRGADAARKELHAGVG